MKNLTIREADISDIETITNFQLAMALESEKLELDRNILSKGVKAVFEDPFKGKYYVAEFDGRVVASLMTTYEWSDWRNGMVIWIQSVFVLPENRKSGLFRMMYHHLKSMVENDSYYRGLRLYVDNSNKNAISVYRNIGMNGDHYRVFEYMKD
jgi:ribosomal protein S18 acetylase RimI-like enzyme